MEYRRFENKIYVRLDPGEEILRELEFLAEREDIRLASISGLGALNELEVCVFDPAAKEFYSNFFQEPLEITSLTGTVTEMDERPYLHLHLSAGNAKGNVVGGHLKRAVVSATAEIVLSITNGVIERRFDEESGLNLFHFS